MAGPAGMDTVLLAALLLAGGAAVGDEARKVGVELYYQALSLKSAGLVVNQLAKIVGDDGLFRISNIVLVPYGNAHMSSKNDTIHCQNGPDECLLNTVEACAIDTWPDKRDQFRFIRCIAFLVKNRRYRQWKSCFERLGLNPKHVRECYKGERGYELQLMYKRMTDALEPPHSFVPWVLVNKKPLRGDYWNVIAYICKAYKGLRPRACRRAAELGRRLEAAGDDGSYNAGDVELEQAEDEGAGEVMAMALPDGHD